MKARGLYAAAVAVAALVAGGWSRGGAVALADTSDGVPFTVAEAVGTVHRVNQLGIQAGRIAQRLGSTEALKKYGATLEHDHATADEQLNRYAARRHVDMDTAPPIGIGSELVQARNELQNLTRLGGSSFDLAFAELMRRDQRKAMTMVERARTEIPDPELKGLLGALEPELREHEQSALHLLSESDARARSDGTRPRATAH